MNNMLQPFVYTVNSYVQHYLLTIISDAQTRTSIAIPLFGFSQLKTVNKLNEGFCHSLKRMDPKNKCYVMFAVAKKQVSPKSFSSGPIALKPC